MTTIAEILQSLKTVKLNAKLIHLHQLSTQDLVKMLKDRAKDEFESIISYIS